MKPVVVGAVLAVAVVIRIVAILTSGDTASAACESKWVMKTGDLVEYDAEAQCIVAELLAGSSQAEFLSLVHKTFIEWFSPEIAGPESQYAAVSEEVWNAWSSYRPPSS